MTTLILLVAIGQNVKVADLPAWYAKHLQEHKENVARHERLLAAAKRGPIRSKLEKNFIIRDVGRRKQIAFKSQKIRDEYVTSIAKTLKRLQESTPAPPLSLRSAKSGDVGKLRSQYDDKNNKTTYRVIQVVGPTDVIVEEFIDFYGSTVTRETMFWLQSVGTDNLNDGGAMAPKGPYLVLGNKTYTSLLGNRTVLLLEPFTDLESETRE